MEIQMKKSKNTPKIPPTHKTTNPKHNDDYVFVEKPGEDFTALKLISGPFASIVYHYGQVGFDTVDNTTSMSSKFGTQNTGIAAMKFDYTIMENRIEADTDSQEFINHIGDILVVLLDEKMKEREEEGLTLDDD